MEKWLKCFYLYQWGSGDVLKISDTERSISMSFLFILLNGEVYFGINSIGEDVHLSKLLTY